MKLAVHLDSSRERRDRGDEKKKESYREEDEETKLFIVRPREEETYSVQSLNLFIICLSLILGKKYSVHIHGPLGFFIIGPRKKQTYSVQSLNLFIIKPREKIFCTCTSASGCLHYWT